MPRSRFEALYRCESCGERFIASYHQIWFLAASIVALAVLVSIGLWSGGAVDYDVNSVQGAASDVSLIDPLTDTRAEYAADLSADALRRDAEGGGSNSQYRLAMSLFERYRINKDFTVLDEAVNWLRESASSGYPRAQAEMGNIYIDGRGVVQDFAEAANWYRRAAEQGDAEAMYGLGAMSQSGWGMDEDLVDAYVWLNLASARGEPRANELRSHVLALLSAEQLHEAQERSRDLDQTIP